MRRVLVTGSVVVLLAATACGGDGDAKDGGKDGGKADGGGPPVALTGTVNDHGTKDARGGGEVEVELDDFYFGPTFVRAAPGATLTLKLENEGAAAHTLTIDGLGVDVTVQPDAKGEASVTLPASGAVRFYCRFHQGQGMQGAFYFNPGDAVGGTGASPGGATPSGSGGDGAYNQ
ncbi:MAG TPA: cupredoxin domain-containing protein [Frankiaceae bacterium]|jgi:plastocyanin|nr:cupredoxin domain-containing protein [Frankiaceae bacterium]